MALKTLLGRWKGGPGGDGAVMTIFQTDDNKLQADGISEKGTGRAGLHGACLKHGAELRGYYYNTDAGVTEGNRLTCTITVALDLAADPSGNTAVGKYKTKDGGSGEWTAKRFVDGMIFKREGGKIVSFAYKSKAVFESLTKDVWAERASKSDKQLAELVETLGPKPWTDGAGGTGYIPGPGVGDLYMTEGELERKLKADVAAHAESAPARYEAEIAALEAKLAKGGGDADALKKRLDTVRRLLKGALGEAKLKERKHFYPGNGPPPGERPLEYAGSEYLDAMGLRRALRKADEEHNAKTGERLEAEMAALDAKIAKGEGDVDAFKKRRELCGRLLAGFKGTLKLAERPVMKPPSGDAHLASERPLEHVRDDYKSAYDLERELAKADAEHWKLFAARLEAEVPGLEAKIAKGEGDVDALKKRFEVVKKLLRGEKVAEKLKERPALKGGVKVSSARLSASIAMHKINVHRALKSMRRAA